MKQQSSTPEKNIQCIKGRPYAVSTKQKAVELYKASFYPTEISEVLTKETGRKMCPRTVYVWLRAAGVLPHRGKRSKHREAKELAKARGEKFYVGLECTNGHNDARRWVSNSKCVECWWAEKRKNPEGTMLRSGKSRAKKRGIKFDLTLEDLRELWPPDNMCPIFDTPLISNDGDCGPRDNSPSLDRIDPAKGYIKGNVAIISVRANRIKSDVTDPALFRKMADWLEQTQS